MAFRDQLWASVEDVYQQIVEHPFIHGLTDGTLPHASFRHYVVQDAHYLREYARALSVCAAKAPDERVTAQFAGDAAGAVAAEQQLHAAFLRAFGSSAGEAAHQPVLPATRAYTSYLLATVYGGTFAEGLGAVLPCYWIYARVGARLLEKGSPDPLYQRWIDTYGGEDYQRIVDAVLDVVDQVGEDLAPAERDRVMGHFTTTSRYEWMFWDAAWRGEVWPV